MAISVEYRGASAWVRFLGDLTIEETRDVFRRFNELAHKRAVQKVDLDFSNAGRMDSAGALVVSLGRSMLEERGKTAVMHDLSDAHEAAFRLLPEHAPEPPPPPPQPGILERIGEAGYAAGDTARDLMEMIRRAAQAPVAWATRRERPRLGATIEQMVAIGAQAFFIVALLGLLIGLVLAFQSAYQLRGFGAQIFVADIVSLGMVREFGPLITAIILAGRSGAAIAAELGTMTINEEVDALRTMGIDPVRFLVLPRLLAITIVQPLLTLISMAVGIAGGIAVAALLELPPRSVFYRMQEALTGADFALGVFKSVLFAWSIGIVGCLMGLRTKEGAQSVGRNTTRAVVASIILIVSVDSLVTTVWTLTYGT